MILEHKDCHQNDIQTSGLLHVAILHNKMKYIMLLDPRVNDAEVFSLNRQELEFGMVINEIATLTTP